MNTEEFNLCFDALEIEEDFEVNEEVYKKPLGKVH